VTIYRHLSRFDDLLVDFLLDSETPAQLGMGLPPQVGRQQECAEKPEQR